MSVLEPLRVTEQERVELERLVRARTAEQRLAQRARMVLAASRGRSLAAIAREEGVAPDTVARWRHRFVESGMAGLTDMPRSGRPPVYDHDDRVAIVAQVCEPPPAGASHWTLSDLQAALEPAVGISMSQLHKLLDELDLKPWKTQSWLTSHDPDFWDKAADVCGLYLEEPGDNAVVYSVDEKTSMQAKAPINSTKPARPGLIERREFEYRRHGTASLFAALDVHTGQVIGQPTERNRAVDFIGFLEHLDEITDDELTIHLVLDNGSSHVAKDTRKWLDAPVRKKRFVVHHTPTHASWLNQIELFFSILTRRVIKRGEFTSVEDLVDKLLAFINNYNHTATPFRWTYDGRPLKAA